MWKASRRNFFAHKGRLWLSLIAVVLSVAFVTGTLMFTSTITTTFDRLFATTASDVAVAPKADKDAAVGSAEQTLPASVLDTVKALPGVQAVYGDVTHRAAGRGRRRTTRPSPTPPAARRSARTGTPRRTRR